MDKDIIDHMLKNPNIIPLEVDSLNNHSLEELCILRKRLIIKLGYFEDKLPSLEEDYKTYEGRNKELLKEVIYLIKEDIIKRY